MVKIYESAVEFEEHSQVIGTIITTKKEIKIAVTDGYLQILKLQMAGKKVMTSGELLNGTTISGVAKTS